MIGFVKFKRARCDGEKLIESSQRTKFPKGAQLKYTHS